MNPDTIKERRARRERFLRTLYEQVDGNVNEFVDGIDIGSRVNADEAETRRIIAYFEEKQLIVVDDHKAGIIRITAGGVDEVEEGIAGRQ